MKKIIYITLCCMTVPLNAVITGRGSGSSVGKSRPSPVTSAPSPATSAQSAVMRIDAIIASRESESSQTRAHLSESLFLQAFILSWVMSVQNSSEKKKEIIILVEIVISKEITNLRL